MSGWYSCGSFGIAAYRILSTDLLTDRVITGFVVKDVHDHNVRRAFVAS